MHKRRSSEENANQVQQIASLLRDVNALFLMDRSERATDLSGWLMDAGARVSLCTTAEARRLSDVAFLAYSKRFDLVVLGAGTPAARHLELAERLALRCAALVLVDAPDRGLLERIYLLGGTYRHKDTNQEDFLLAACQALDNGFPNLERICAYAAHVWRLPPQLQRVLQLDLWSFTDDEIAKTMSLSVHTVQEYQEALRRRTGARSKHGHLRQLLQLRGAPPPST